MRIWFAGALASATLLAGAGAAQAADAERAIPVPEREAKPSEVAAAYPKAALARKISGDVELDCAAGLKGELIDCKVTREEPAGEGFGQAGLSLAARERVALKDRDGQPLNGRRFTTYYNFLAPGDANPDWMRKPTASELAGVYPRGARVDGKAIITCELSLEGFLQKCKVGWETPEGQGFGAAALLLAPQFRMTPKIRGGKPVTTEISIPILWKGLASASQPIVGNTLVLDPPWTTTPSAAEMRAAWPSMAKDVDSGQAALRCDIDKTGKPTHCETISEIPVNRGFAKAARSLADRFQINVGPDAAKDMRKYSVDIPFRFRDPALPDARKINAPRWIKTLTPEGMSSIYPEAAIRAGVNEGLGVVGCVIAPTGDLTQCAVRREQPAELGFGAAAVEAAKLMAVNPWSKEGEPLDGLPIVVPIRFTWKEATAEAPPPAKP
ncbi:MAG: energy transducer TonB [Caulobacter sp.]|nr:energy transducer TonB [Caulobacter sp.]